MKEDEQVDLPSQTEIFFWIEYFLAGDFNIFTRKDTTDIKYDEIEEKSKLIAVRHLIKIIRFNCRM